MLDQGHNKSLPPIPAKRYFTIGEVSTLCDVKQHVLRYWENEFDNLNPVKRRGNRRYYQRNDVMMIRQIRSLPISGARQKLNGKVSEKEASKSYQVIQQTRVELEEILDILK